jgi:hypothetical protein
MTEAEDKKIALVKQLLDNAVAEMERQLNEDRFRSEPRPLFNLINSRPNWWERVYWPVYWRVRGYLTTVWQALSGKDFECE